ncbi:MAG: 50S ribosomal protein L28 [Phycisphaerales bacterium]|jgi:large subunit ribosomal protein L28
MPRRCHFTGAKTSSGNKITRRGKAKYLGGVGIKTTGCTKRTFKPNLQNVTAVIDGRPVRVKVSVRAIRQGLVVKPIRRKAVYSAAKAG